MSGSSESDPECSATEAEMEVTLNFRAPSSSSHATSFPRDTAHARERLAASAEGQEVRPQTVRLIDGRVGHDYVEAERSAVAELLGGGGRGFVLLRHHSAVTDWHDAKEVRSVYYPEIKALVERLLPGVTALTPSKQCHIIRSELDAAGQVAIHSSCHNDFAENHGADLVKRDNEITQEILDRHRLLEVSCWRNIDRSSPIERLPLAICDRTTVVRDDLQAIPLVFGDLSKGDDAPWADFYVATHRAGQDWFYFPAMRDDELLLLVQYDSAPERPHRCAAMFHNNSAQFSHCVHTAATNLFSLCCCGTDLSLRWRSLRAGVVSSRRYTQEPTSPGRMVGGSGSRLTSEWYALLTMATPRLRDFNIRSVAAAV